MIVLCAGGTGGHVFPAEGLAFALKKRGYKLALITDKRAMNFVNYEYFDSIKVINIERNNIFNYIYTLLKSTFISMFFLKKHKAKIVVGFGGYPSLPGMLAAKLLLKKCLIHEQNAVLGRANRFLSNFSNGLAVSFLPTKHSPNSAKFIGNPVRKLVQVAMAKQKTRNLENFHICVIGGSQGAKLFSEILPKAIGLLSQELRRKIIVTQQCRAEQLKMVSEIYNDLGVKSTLESFFNDMPDRLRNTNLAVCRAGASTVAELTCLGVPAIFIPLAISKDNDQGENAQSIINAGGGWIVNEKELSPEKLAELIEIAMKNPSILEDMANSMHKLAKPDAAKDLANWVESFL